MVVTINNKNNANNNSSNVTAGPTEHSLCYDKQAELIKSLKTYTPQQSSQYITTNDLATTHNVTMSLSGDNVSIKYAHFQRFRHAISATFSQKATV